MIHSIIRNISLYDFSISTVQLEQTSTPKTLVKPLKRAASFGDDETSTYNMLRLSFCMTRQTIASTLRAKILQWPIIWKLIKHIYIYICKVIGKIYEI